MTKIPSLLLGQRRCDWETDLCVSTEKGQKRGKKKRNGNWKNFTRIRKRGGWGATCTRYIDNRFLLANNYSIALIIS